MHVEVQVIQVGVQGGLVLWTEGEEWTVVNFWLKEKAWK